MNRIAQTLLAVPLLAFLLPSPASASGPEFRVLASVDGNPVTTRDLEELLASQPPPAPGQPVQGLAPDGVLRRLVENRLLEEEGFRIGADEEQDVKDQVWDFRRHHGMMALLDSIRAEVGEPDPQKFSSAMNRSSTMWRVYHIRVGSERLARALMDSVRAGADFATLAKRHSTDTTTAARDGELGWAREDLYIPEFRSVLTGVEKGGLAGPVKLDDGWHVLLLGDTRTETVGQSSVMVDQLREAATRDAVMKRVKEFVESLEKKYHVTVDGKVRDSLDYASTDAAVQKKLHDSQQIVARLPWKEIHVADLTRQIRFQYFHGLEGRTDAGAIRDKVLSEWITELLLRQEAGERGYDRTPEIMARADALRRELMREYVGKRVLDVAFEAAPGDVEAYYAAHKSEFTAPPRVRADAVVLSDEGAAKRFRDQLQGGTKLKWLAARTPEVTDAAPARFSDWVDPRILGLTGPAKPGQVVGPVPGESGFLVATVTRVETPQPAPLSECRDRVVDALKRQRVQELMTRAIEKLRSSARVEIAEGAKEAIGARLEIWKGEVAAGGAAPAMMSPHGGSR